MQILKKTEGKAYRKSLKLGQKGVIDLIREKGLTGRGGGGFPTGAKWEMVFNEDADEKFVICNADEGEPGTFKDKLILTKNPEAVIEGILIASYAVGADNAFIYLRGEYDYLESKLKKAIIDVNCSLSVGKKKSDLIIYYDEVNGLSNVSSKGRIVAKVS